MIPTDNWYIINANMIVVVIGMVWATFACSRQKGDWDWDLWSALQVIWLVVVVLPVSCCGSVLFINSGPR